MPAVIQHVEISAVVIGFNAATNIDKGEKKGSVSDLITQKTTNQYQYHQS